MHNVCIQNEQNNISSRYTRVERGKKIMYAASH